MVNTSYASKSPTRGISSRDVKKCDYTVYKMKRDFFPMVFALGLVLSVNCQYGQSPCPEIFSYQSDGNSVYGYISLKPSGGSVSSLLLRANFTVAAQLPTTYIGQIETIGHGNQQLQKFNRGVPLQYRVNFPVTSPLPRLTSIAVNGNVICYGPGDIPSPHQYVTTISLDHMLYLKGGNPQTFNPFENPDSDIDFPGQYGDNTQIFNINDIGNRDGTWSLVYPDRRPVQVARPTRPAVVRPKPTQSRPSHPQPEQPGLEYPQSQRQPDYNIYYPDRMTTTARPQTTRPPPPPSPPPTQALPASPPWLPSNTAVECGVITGGNEQIPLIFNGNSYPRGDWPWLVAIYKRQEGSLTFICSGTLVSERHIVSAAHCMHLRNTQLTIKDIVVKVGVYNLEDWGDDISMTRTLQTARIHESYNSSTLENDLIVFTMERTVEFNNYIRPACLWNGNTDLGLIVGASGVVAGWGQSEISPVGKGEPRMVRIPIVSTAACRASKPEFHKLTSPKTICAGDRKGSGPCLGDSGGGLYVLDNGRWRLRGVVSVSLKPSNGEHTCNLNEYVVFTDTAQYLNWIQKSMSQNLFDY